MSVNVTSNVIPLNEKILTDDETKDLLRIAQQGNSEKAQQAKERIIIGNTRLVLYLIHKMNVSEDIDELFQIGCIGLMKAIEKFDFSHNVKFNTFASIIIINDIKKHLQSCQLIHIPSHIHDQSSKIRAAFAQLEKQLKRKPTPYEIYQRTGIPADKIEYINGVITATAPISLSEFVLNEANDGVEYSEIIRDPQTEDDIITNIDFRQAINSLTEQEKIVIDMIANKGMTQIEAAKAMNVSQAKISRTYARAIQKIKNHIS